jgi:hypothetical protein
VKKQETTSINWVHNAYMGLHVTTLEKRVLEQNEKLEGPTSKYKLYVPSSTSFTWTTEKFTCQPLASEKPSVYVSPDRWSPNHICVKYNIKSKKRKAFNNQLDIEHRYTLEVDIALCLHETYCSVYFYRWSSTSWYTMFLPSVPSTSFSSIAIIF